MQHFQSNMHWVRTTLFSVEPVLSSSAVHQVRIGFLTVFRCYEISCLRCSRKATQIWTTFNQRGSKVPSLFVLQNRSRCSLLVASRGKLPNSLTVLRPTAPASAVIPSEWFARWSQHTWQIRQFFIGGHFEHQQVLRSAIIIHYDFGILAVCFG